MTEEEKIQESNAFFQRLKENDRKAEEKHQEFERNSIDIEPLITALYFMSVIAFFILFFLGLIALLKYIILNPWS